MKAYFRETPPWWKSKPMNFHHLGFRRSVRAAIFLPLILALAHCKRPEQDLGLDLQPEGDLLNVLYTDTFTLRAFTLTEDSLRSDELSQSLVGNTVDPETGQIQASFYAQLRLNTPSVDFGANPVCDSVVLALKYTGQFWGPLMPQEFKVYELAESLSQEAEYFTNQAFETTGENLVRPGVGLLETNLTRRPIVGNDTVNPQLRLPLDVEFGERLINAGAEVYASNEGWLDYFKGIHVFSATPNAAVVNFDLVDVESRMRLYYHNDTDTLFFDYVINSNSARSNRYNHAYGGLLAGLTPENPANGQARTWIQGGARLKTRIELPFLMELNKQPQRVINKAELILPVTNPPSSRTPNVPLLFVLTENADGSAVGLPGQLSTTIDIGGNYEPLSNRYRFNITRWMQEYLNGNMAVNFLNIVSSNGGITVGRIGLNGPEASAEDVEQNMRLVVTYTQ